MTIMNLSIERKIQKNVPLSSLTTFKIGGPARYFLTVGSQDELVEAIRWAENGDIPCFVLGGGSNVLVADQGFNGLVIKLSMTDCQLSGAKITVGASLSLMQLVKISIRNGLSGLEWAAGIPGTVGGAVRGNAGAFGHSISECLEKVEVLRDKKIIELKNRKIRFSYRQSVFKENKDIILRVILLLKKGDARGDREQVATILSRRLATQPSEPSAGCVFKNPESNSAGLLIEECGLKGKRIGGAEVSRKHANFIINTGTAKAEDVLNLIKLIKRKVRDKFGVELEEEVEYVK